MGSRSLTRWMLFLALILAAAAANPAEARPPNWLRAIEQRSLPEYPAETNAVVLLDEARTVVRKSGEIRSYYRIAYKILNPEGTALAWIRLPFDEETKISNLKAWNLKEGGIVHEVTNKEAGETQLFGNVLFEDTKSMLLLIPQVEVGNIIGYEYERRHRPYILQDFWYFQQRYPVLQSRFLLEIPSDWTFHHQMLNHPDVPPRETGKNRWAWELDNLPGISEEEGMPPVSTVAAKLAVAYFPEKRAVRGQTFDSWDTVAGWFSGFMTPRAVPNGSITEVSNQLATKRSLAEFVQKQIRYVAIEIGIGGYQPHFASEIFRNKYGDCKDKVTLLKSLLQPLGVDLYPVLIHAGGGGLAPEFPSPLYFNHLIAAIPLGEGEKAGPAVLDHPELGRLLLFDPTDPRTPFGQLPAALQGTTALLVQNSTGYVIETPVTPPLQNRLLRTAKLQLLPNGRLEGDMQETYWGIPAARERNALLGKTHDHWMRMSQSFLARWLPGVAVEKFGVGNLESGPMLQETFHFVAPYFGQEAGELLLFHPCVLGSLVYRLPNIEDHKYPVQFRYLRSNSDIFEITLPPGFVVEQLPEPVEHDLPFAHYRSAITQEGNVLKYTRTLEIKQLTVPPEEVPALRDFYQMVDRDERSVVLLKRKAGLTSG